MNRSRMMCFRIGISSANCRAWSVFIVTRKFNDDPATTELELNLVGRMMIKNFSFLNGCSSLVERLTGYEVNHTSEHKGCDTSMMWIRTRLEIEKSVKFV